MDLIFQTSGGNPFCIEVGYFDTVLEIKEKIQKHHGIPIPKQTLIFNGNILHDDLNVHHSDILDQSRIHLLLASDAPVKTPDQFPPPSKIHLLLKLPSSKLIAVEADVKDTIQRLKERIHEMEGISVGRLVIHRNGIELLNQKTIEDCELLDHCELTVGVRSPPSGSSQGSMGGSAPKLRVFILYSTEKIPLEVNPMDNVGELRKKLEKMKMELPRDGYFFIFKQNVMDDDRSFRWHHVNHGDAIEIFGGSISGGS